MPVEGGGYEPVDTGDGYSVESNTESAQDIRTNLGLDKPAEAEPAAEVEATGADGKTRNDKGQFKAKPIPAKAQAKKDAEAEPEKPEEKAKPAEEEKPEAKPEPKEAKAEEKPEEPEEKPERRSKANERIRELIRERDEARELASALARERSRPEPKEEAAPAKVEPWKQPDDPSDPRPKEENFDNYADFVEARARWASRQEYRQVEQQRYVQQRAVAFQKSIESALERYKQAIDAAGGPSFIDSMPEELQNLRPSFVLVQGERPGPLNALADEILASSDATRMMRYLAEHPDALRRLSTPSLSRRQFEREMGKIEAALDSASAGASENKPPPFVPKANGPVRPATGAPTATNLDEDLDPDTTPYEKWKSVMDARDRRARA